MDPEAPVIDVLLGNHQLDGEDSSTEELQRFIRRLPSWSVPLFWTYDGQQWEF